MPMRIIKTLLLSLAVVFAAGFVTVPALAAGTDFKGDACSGLQAVEGNNSSACPAGSEQSLSRILRTVISLLSLAVGIIAVIMIIVAGFKFITAGGDSSNIASARSTITYALVGLVIAALAQVLVHFVLFQTSGAAPCPTNGSIAAKDAQCKK